MTFKMPNQDQFLDGYDFRVSTFILGGWTLVKREAEHHMILLYNEYSYPVTLTFCKRVTANFNESEEDAKLIDELTKHIKAIRVIYSDSGRPYKCKLDKINVISKQTGPASGYEGVFRIITVNLDGFSKRIGRAEAARVQETGAW